MHQNVMDLILLLAIGIITITYYLGTIDDKPSLHIGRAKFHKESFNASLKDLKTAYDIQIQEKQLNYLDLARIMNNLGLIYLEEKKYNLALDFHFDEIKIYKRYLKISELLLANS